MEHGPDGISKIKTGGETSSVKILIEINKFIF